MGVEIYPSLLWTGFMTRARSVLLSHSFNGLGIILRVLCPDVISLAVPGESGERSSLYRRIRQCQKVPRMRFLDVPLASWNASISPSSVCFHFTWHSLGLLFIANGCALFQFSSVHSDKENAKRTSNLTFSWHSLLSSLLSLLGVQFQFFCEANRNRTELALMDAF